MKRLKNKTMKIILSKKRFRKNQKRKYKVFSSKINDNHSPITLVTPKKFSFIYNLKESLDFFELFMSYIKIKDTKILINMENTESMTIEVLLYIISLDKTYKESKAQVNITPPKDKDLKLMMAQSGFSKYFKANIDLPLIHKAIFTIKDGESNKKRSIDDSQTCKDAIDFLIKKLDTTKKDPLMRKMFNSLAEMMLNTDNHAYDLNNNFRNWYLFGIENSKGIAFYFFDNGKGIVNTAKKTLLEKLGKACEIGLADKNIIKSVFNGEYRSATKKPNRNKGAPQIYDFLTQKEIEFSLVLTNKVQYILKEDNITVSNKNFMGTLFVWVIKKEQYEQNNVKSI